MVSCTYVYIYIHIHTYYIKKVYNWLNVFAPPHPPTHEREGGSRVASAKTENTQKILDHLFQDKNSPTSISSHKTQVK